MIGKLRGIADSITEDGLILDVHGVGYLVYTSPRILSEIILGQEMVFIIETHVREDHIHLYGFLSEVERDWFRLLWSVQGVGAKIALAALGQFTPDTLSQMIAARDNVMFTRIAGVGKKLAERIVNELKEKVALPQSFVVSDKAVTKGAAVVTTPNVNDEAISALVNLGYPRLNAFSAVAKVSAGGELKLEDIIRKALMEI